MVLILVFQRCMEVMRQKIGRAIVWSSVLLLVAYALFLIAAAVFSLVDLPALFTIAPVNGPPQRSILAEDAYLVGYGKAEDEQLQMQMQHGTVVTLAPVNQARTERSTFFPAAKPTADNLKDYFLLDQLLPDPNHKSTKVSVKKLKKPKASTKPANDSLLPDEYPSLRIGRLWLMREMDRNTNETTTMTHKKSTKKTEKSDFPELNSTGLTGTIGNNGPVIVTALLDIGRGQWFSYRRPYDEYLRYFAKLLKLQNRFVIFADKRGADFVRQKRMPQTVKLFEITLRDLPLFRYRDEIDRLMTAEQQQWQAGWDSSMRNHPEAKSADYDIVVNSKPWFLYNASQIREFHGATFAWIDAGYGHGETKTFPSNGIWQPKFPPNRISLIKVTPTMDPITRYTIGNLYRKDWSVVSGGFLAGDSTAIGSFYRFYQKILMELLNGRKFDDDQTILVLLIKAYPNLFNIIHGGWFGAFKL